MGGLRACRMRCRARRAGARRRALGRFIDHPVMDASLRNLGGSPLLIIATGRAELESAHPALWAERGAERIALSELTRDASERLVRQMLADPLPDVMTQL